MSEPESAIPEPEYVPVQVPVALVPEVYALISERMLPAQVVSPAGGRGMVVTRSRKAGPAPIAAGAGSSPFIRSREADETWPDDLLKQAYEESSPAMRAILDAMADAPDHRFTTREFADAAGFAGERGYWSVPGTMGGFTKRAKNRYGRELWPFAWEKLDDNSFLYWMPEGIAARFRAVRDS
jgi:hypothetical protein